MVLVFQLTLVLLILHRARQLGRVDRIARMQWIVLHVAATPTHKTSRNSSSFHSWMGAPTFVISGLHLELTTA
jgi:hypothetical protein